MNRWERTIDRNKLFWQYPVCTEKQFFLQNSHCNDYLPFPWATVLDRRIDLNAVKRLLSPLLEIGVEYYTCCQHIRFRELESLFRDLNIAKLYTPHKRLGEENLGNIALIASPLFAVNYEDDSRNALFQNVNFLEVERDYLFSFMGGLQSGYLTDIRSRIFKTKFDRDDIFIKNTGGWHFNELVYSNKQNYDNKFEESVSHKNNTEKYNEVLLNSRFSLCPSGTGPSSIRFWESLAVGAIPVLLSDTMDLPKHSLWPEAVIFMKEKDYENICSVLESVSPEEEETRRSNCLEIYKHFRSNYADKKTRPLVHYCCGTYSMGDFGGVACYDSQLLKVFPHRVFFQGSHQINNMDRFLERYEHLDPIVITDNHLACDVSNKWETFLVHHGVALTHAIREPTWDPYWRNLCCSGQDRMLYYRNTKNTKIISTSKFCTDEFTKHYGEEYKKFTRIDIPHSSELDENKRKEKWNDKPVVLGNWSTNNKGREVVRSLQLEQADIIFQNLDVKYQGNIEEFLKNKQKQYLNSDIFLQLSLSEGNSFATLDALMMGMPIVATNVGLFYKDVPEECFVKIEWQNFNNKDYILERILYAWQNKESLSSAARSWYMKNYNSSYWDERMRETIEGK